MENVGTGGLLIMYAKSLYNNGSIESNGSSNDINDTSVQIPGGSSGGGSINIFYIDNCIENASSNGGKATLDWGVEGGAGGNGSVTYSQIVL